MLAQGIPAIQKSLYCHVYNRGVENTAIFDDEEDYRVFLDYLKDYLSVPADPESAKKIFNIRGRAFRGTPHQPKNYFDQLELVAYSLSPNHFHLVINLKQKDSLQGFIRSLCTRYSMYFNKKQHRTGPLFRGPYKSLLIQDEACVLFLTRHLHSHGFSSYPEYLNTRVTPWVKPAAVLTYFEKTKSNSFKGLGSYKDFVEKYQPGQKEKELLEKISLEDKTLDLEKREPVSKNQPTPSRIRTPELTAASGIFVILLALGLRNIIGSSKNIVTTPSPTSSVLSETVETKESTETVETKESKKMLSVKATKGSANVNIHQEPAVNSKTVGKAKEGDIFEYVSINSGWYEIKFPDGSTGFISEELVVVMP